jgi:hypothetical protein
VAARALSKQANGRPTKFHKGLMPILKTLYRKGCTDAEVAESLEINAGTLYNWKKQHPEFFKTISDWKDSADSEIERSLFERAHGYSHPESTPKWIDGHWEYSSMVKHYPPDATSMIFWLKNRQPTKWRDKLDVGFDLAGAFRQLGAVLIQSGDGVEEIEEGKPGGTSGGTSK